MPIVANSRMMNCMATVCTLGQVVKFMLVILKVRKKLVMAFSNGKTKTDMKVSGRMTIAPDTVRLYTPPVTCTKDSGLMV